MATLGHTVIGIALIGITVCTCWYVLEWQKQRIELRRQSHHVQPPAPAPSSDRYRIVRGPMGGGVKLWIEKFKNGQWVPVPIVGPRNSNFNPHYDTEANVELGESRLRRKIAEWIEADTATTTVLYEMPEPTPPPQPTAIDEMPPRPRGIVVPKR